MRTHGKTYLSEENESQRNWSENMDPAAILKKPYARMIFHGDDGTYSAEIVEFPGCFAIGSSASEALSQLDETAIDWITTALSQGQDIPEPMETTDYSGRLVVRLPRSLHQRCALYADRDGVSLNQFIVTALAERVRTCPAR